LSKTVRERDFVKEPLTHAEFMARLFGDERAEWTVFAAGNQHGKKLRLGVAGPGVKVDWRGRPLGMPPDAEDD
jgi:hypothetical protein